MDALAEALSFEHGHVTIAICQPTRAVWMTGRYPHNSGSATPKLRLTYPPYRRPCVNKASSLEYSARQSRVVPSGPTPSPTAADVMK